MTHRQRLVAAVAGPGTLAVSTAGFFLPANSGDSLFFAALLNSALANAWYKVRDLNRAIKISYLRQLPVREHPKTWRSISVLAMECVSLRTFFHKRMNSCTLKEEASRLSVRFPEEWCRLVEHQREIDQKIFELYEISKARREAILRLTATRVF